MKLVIDENIVFAKDAFAGFGDLTFANGRDITPELVKDAEVLLVRSITKVNEDLLKDSKVKFVGTATIGTDHIDLDYLKENEIEFASAKGSNADSVAEYVLSAITYIANKFDFTLKGKSLGIIGVGNIGSRVAKIGEALGMRVIKNDPPLQRKTGSDEYRPISEALEADIITCHVPLNKTGVDKTLHLIDEKELEKIASGKLLINSSRGEVINNQALKERLLKSNDIFTVLDVWENEPTIDTDLLKLVNIGTAHIAGYSLDGKVNGTVMLYDRFCEFLSCDKTWTPNLPSVENNCIQITQDISVEKLLKQIFENVYPIGEDDLLFRKQLELNPNERGKYFDSLRKQYRVRREIINYKIEQNYPEEFKQLLSTLRINFIT